MVNNKFAVFYIEPLVLRNKIIHNKETQHNMKIKLAILEKDLSYLNRIVSVFSTKYADKFEIYSFTDPNVAISSLKDTKIDVLIANDVFEINVENLPKRCGFAYFVDSADIDTKNDQRAICKFQKADLIYKQILSVYSENAGNISKLKIDEGSAKIAVFSSPCGGTGTSTLAAACAMHFAAKGRKTIYLNLEKFGSSDSFFSADGQFDMSDISFALKSRKTNLSIKLESCVKQDASGVFFYSQPKVALDVIELNAEDIIHLISEIELSGQYEYIIVDLDFSIGEDALKILRNAHSVVWVGDGSDVSNLKISRALQSLSISDTKSDSPLINRIHLVYNKFSNRTGKVLTNIELKNIGGMPKYEHATTDQVLKQIFPMDMLEKVF